MAWSKLLQSSRATTSDPTKAKPASDLVASHSRSGTKFKSTSKALSFRKPLSKSKRTLVLSCKRGAKTRSCKSQPVEVETMSQPVYCTDGCVCRHVRSKTVAEQQEGTTRRGRVHDTNKDRYNLSICIIYNGSFQTLCMGHQNWE